MTEKQGGSFRDPAGFVFIKGGEIYRQVNKEGAEDYEFLMSSGLYDELAGGGMLVPHAEEGEAAEPGAHKILKPLKIPFISYPYEWCFSRLKDAALLTLELQKRALDKGMSLKDASAYNIQFLKGRPVLIDTLSFEKYTEGKPWVAYNQFCRHFLAPLALMSHRDIRFGRFFTVFLDGIPLDFASRMLPAKTYLNFPLLSNIHMHAKSQMHFGDKKKIKRYYKKKMSKFALRGIIDSLETGVRRLKWEPGGTEWSDYYGETNYTEGSLCEKEKIIKYFLEKAGGGNKFLWDLGGNTGRFSRLAANKGLYTLSFDIDPSAVEKNYRKAKENGEENIFPLIEDITNPGPALGWENRERESLINRGPADIVLALAFVQHLAISNNTPFSRIAKLFFSLCRDLIIEFVPVDDSQVEKMLIGRKNIFSGYTRENFEKEFRAYFRIMDKKNIPGTKRTLYFMRKGD